MKIIIAGGSGHVGAALRRHFAGPEHDITLLSRRGGSPGTAEWDGKTLGAWANQLDGADVVINLAGRSVNCRYTPANLREMMDSRVESARVIGQAIAAAERPPRVWLQASTATIYAHRFDADNDEATGIIGGDEPNAPAKWRASVEIARAWEKTLDNAPTPSTRKVALRSAMTMSPDHGSIFWTLCSLARRGLGGQIGDGRQYMSWIHELDFCRAVDFLIECEDISGPVNLSAPYPLPQAEFMRTLRQALHIPLGLPATRWMVELGTRLLGTESELVLKSRRVTPGRLLAAGFEFSYPTWPKACAELVSRLKSGAEPCVG